MIDKPVFLLPVRLILLGTFVAFLIVGLTARDEYEMVRTMVRFLCIDCIGLALD